MALRKLCSLACVTLLSVGAAIAEPQREPGPVLDANYGHVLFEFYQADYFDAIVELLAARSRGRMPNHDDDAELLLGGLYLSYGLHEASAEIFDTLLATRTDPAVRDRTWFFLAKIRYQRGYLSQALAALDAIRGQLPAELEPERRMMRSQILMRLGRYAEAAVALERWKSPADWYHFASYNLGVALLRAGEFQKGVELLTAIGQHHGADREEILGLQDKANVALGFAYLQNGRPAEAKASLQRVRLEGPFSNKALLGAGWADAELENYRRALAPWLELRGRDLLDSAVQESLLAIPYAYGKLAANSEAAQQYLVAIDSYVEETRRLDLAIERIVSGEIVTTLLAGDANDAFGWLWQLDSVPNSYESRYLYHLLASHEFQEALKNFRDLSALRSNLETWRENLEVFSHMLETRRLAFDARLPRAEGILEAADFERLEARHARLKREAGRIEQDEDFVALAPEKDGDLWREIEQFRQTPALDAEFPEAEEARKKLRLLRGVLSWELQQDFAARLWRQTKDLRDIERAIDHAQESRRRVTEALDGEPEHFAHFDARIAGIEPRIDALILELEQLAALQHREVSRIAVAELEDRKSRLDTYTVQARFALASIYDRASGGGSQ